MAAYIKATGCSTQENDHFPLQPRGVTGWNSSSDEGGDEEEEVGDADADDDGDGDGGGDGRECALGDRNHFACASFP